MSSFFDTFMSSSTGNEAFEDFSEEIRDIINEMGYNVEEEELKEIEKDLRFLEDNADVVDQQLFSCLMDRFESFPTDLDQSIQKIADLSQPKPSKSSVLPKELDELITHGYERLQEVYEDIKRYENLIEQMDGTKAGSSKQGSVPVETTPEVLARPNTYSISPQQSEVSGKENRPIEKSVQAEKSTTLNPREENRLINQFLRANALRPTSCPEPGRLPFKHDQRLKLDQYRREWNKLPPPGEQKRMALRWRIRELMLRRDIPCLRLIQGQDGVGPVNDNNPLEGQHRTQRGQPQWKP